MYKLKYTKEIRIWQGMGHGIYSDPCFFSSAWNKIISECIMMLWRYKYILNFIFVPLPLCNLFPWI